MAKQVFSNAASALLAASIDDNDLTIQVDSGYGALYPNPSGGDYFVVTLRNALGDVEYCKITARVGDLLTVPSGGRGFDGSSAQSWTNGQTRVELRVVKNTLEQFIQRGGDSMDGSLDMNGNDLIDASLTGDWMGTNGQLVGTVLRGTEDDSSNEIAVPSDGSRATSGGSPILTEGDDEGVMSAAFAVGMIMMWFGSAGAVPAGWHICDGTNGTPDMRDRFAVGAGSSYANNATGGAASSGGGTTGSAGSHGHTVVVDPHVLTEAEMPSHSHSISGTLTYPGSGLRFGSNESFQASSGGSNTSATGGNQGHSHTGSASSGGDHTHSTPSVATLPPYRALYYIMFIGF